jgi:glucose/arabinose dehydrogenase
VLLVVLAVAAGCGGSAGPAESRQVRTIATGLSVPWGVAFLPGGDALVSERTTGRILRISRDGRRRRAVMRMPGVDTNSGEGGLLGLAVSPRYARDRWVYAYFTSASDNRIVRFRLGGRIRPVLTGLRRGAIHDGGRIAFGPDGKLYAGVGEAGDTTLAQNRRSLNGKILRMNPDGSVPRGNPFPGSLVWSYGHRNVQGLAWDRRGRLWATEFGQNEFDEVNLIRKGGNYGWPEVEGRGSTAEGRSDRGPHDVHRRASGRRGPAGPAERNAGEEGGPAAAGTLRAHPHRRAGARRLAVGDHLEPRRTRQRPQRRRPHRAAPALRDREADRRRETGRPRAARLRICASRAGYRRR